MNRLLLIPVTATLFCACHTAHDYDKVFKDPHTYSQTVHELNTVVMGNNFSPIVASRNYMYAAVAGYEVIAGGYPGKFQSLAGQVHGLSPLPAPPAGATIDFEFAALLAYCKLGEAVTFPEGSMHEYVDSLKKMAKDHGMPNPMSSTPRWPMPIPSAAIMAWSKKDHYLETRGAPEYMVNDSPGRWVPTPPAYTPAMEPHWSEIRYVAMDSVKQFMPPHPTRST
jgi:hypothetical protein